MRRGVRLLACRVRARGARGRVHGRAVRDHPVPRPGGDDRARPPHGDRKRRLGRLDGRERQPRRDRGAAPRRQRRRRDGRDGERTRGHRPVRGRSGRRWLHGHLRRPGPHRDHDRRPRELPGLVHANALLEHEDTPADGLRHGLRPAAVDRRPVDGGDLGGRRPPLRAPIAGLRPAARDRRRPPWLSRQPRLPPADQGRAADPARLPGQPQAAAHRQGQPAAARPPACATPISPTPTR